MIGNGKITKKLQALGYKINGKTPSGNTVSEIIDSIANDYEGGLVVPQEQADWNEADNTAKSFIKNKPELFSGDYNDLENKPITLPTYPETVADKTYVLKLVNGVLIWVEETA